MKHNPKITAILITMFLVTQFIGLIVINADIFNIQTEVNGTVQNVSNPHLYWIQPPDVQDQKDSFTMLGALIVGFAIAVSLLFLFSRFKIEFILRAWFFLVVALALFLTFYAFEKIIPFIPYSLAWLFPLIIAVPLAYIKIYKTGFFVHNITELLIYPGIAAVFVPILSIYTIIIFLVLISVYDMWAVWHSKIMQKMATYQMDKLKIFSGFFVPYASKKVKAKIKKMRAKLSKEEMKKKKFRVNIAILGGGDVVFPILAAGVMLKTIGLGAAIFVILGATLGLAYLFMKSEKKKFYPAMPFITTGIFLGMILAWLVF
jgi:presenilin-like A22 family membrane protease